MRFVATDEAAARELERLVLKAHGSEYPKLPDRIGRVCGERGLSADSASSRRLPNGTLWGWVNRPADAHPIADSASWRIDLSSLAELTEAEESDPGKRGEHAALVAQRLARLTAQERATVAQALAQSMAGASPNRRNDETFEQNR